MSKICYNSNWLRLILSKITVIIRKINNNNNNNNNTNTNTNTTTTTTNNNNNNTSHRTSYKFANILTSVLYTKTLLKLDF